MSPGFKKKLSAFFSIGVFTIKIKLVFSCTTEKLTKISLYFPASLNIQTQDDICFFLETLSLTPTIKIVGRQKSEDMTMDDLSFED